MTDRKRILLVDDDPLLRKILIDIINLDDRLEVVAEATDGQEAIDKYQKIKPDLVTMDIIMAKMDGMVALSKILEQDSKAKIIMVTAMGQQKILEKAFELGAVGFVVKPFEESKVLSTIEDVLGL